MKEDREQEVGGTEDEREDPGAETQGGGAQGAGGAGHVWGGMALESPLPHSLLVDSPAHF